MERLSQNTMDLNEKSEFEKLETICVDCKKPFKCEITTFQKEHNVFIPRFCSECTEKREQERVEEDKKEEERQKKRDIRDKEMRYDRRLLRIPNKYRDIESDNKKIVSEYKGGSMFLYGGVGVGKTVLMSNLAKTVIKKDSDMAWIRYPSFIMELQSSFRDKDKDPFEIAEKIATFKGLLCIDDIGAEKLTDFVRQTTYYILNEREQLCLNTIITSNFSLQQIDEMIDERVSSRIAGMCEVIKLSGTDRRLKKEEQ